MTGLLTQNKEGGVCDGSEPKERTNLLCLVIYVLSICLQEALGLRHYERDASLFLLLISS